jgi:predicted RNA-binding protein with PUA-like domain
MNYWLVKQEPAKYSWQQFLKDKVTLWEGVRNYQARNNLRAMKKGDPVLFYQSVEDPSVVGICEVAKESYPDPTAKEGDWVVVDLKAKETLKKPVTLAEVKANKKLKDIALVRQGRLSVMALKREEYDEILKMSK